MEDESTETREVELSESEIHRLTVTRMRIETLRAQLQAAERDSQLQAMELTLRHGKGTHRLAGIDGTKAIFVPIEE